MLNENFNHAESIQKDFIETRTLSIDLFSPLNIEDAVMQSDPFCSPANWHLSHVTWFFHKILEEFGINIKTDDSLNLSMLNSYYQKFGKPIQKSNRGMLPRPTVKEMLYYRKKLDQSVSEYLISNKNLSSDSIYLMNLAIQHEMQHQELLLYDLQNYFSQFKDPNDNYSPFKHSSPPSQTKSNLHDVDIPGGSFELGYMGTKFCYDNELPSHKVYLENFNIDVYPVTNGEFIEFIEDDGYNLYKYWLSDGWDVISEQNWNSPLYWIETNGKWHKKDFRGLLPIAYDEPIVNISYYEASAYACYKNKRLPTEAEWEKAASWNESTHEKTIYPWGNALPDVKTANLFNSYLWSPSKIGSYPDAKSFYGCEQMIGDVWEWTSTEYSLYPGFKSKYDEYTDKWATGQKVLKGGSFATNNKQITNSYRNYFRPVDRILFSGFRCAQNI